jgi:hypothetical protein
MIFPLTVVALAAALGGCNETTGSTAAPVVAAPIGPAAYKLPPGAGCTAEINRYQEVVQSDRDTGNLEQRVYDDIQRELTKAAFACEAGRDGEARAIVASSRARHGYHA